MSADLSLFDANRAAPKPRVVDACDLGEIRAIVVTESGAEVVCAAGTLVLSLEQYFEFVRYRRAAP